MTSNVLIFLVCTLCVISLRAQSQPNPKTASNIFDNAPSVIRKAMRNVGSKMTGNQELRRSTSIDTPGTVKSPGRNIFLPSVAALRTRFPKPPYMKQVPVPSGITSRQSHEILRRGEPPFMFIRPITISNARNTASKSKGKIVLAMPDDNIHILTAESVRELGRAPNIIPTTLTIRQLGDEDFPFSRRKNNYRNKSPSTTTVKYGSQIPTPPNRYQESRHYNSYRNRNHRYRYNIMPLSHNTRFEDNSEDDSRYFGQASNHEKESSFEDYDELVSAGGHVTVIKAQKAAMPKLLKAQRISGSPGSPMKAILIEPKELKAKRFTVVKTDSRQVSPMKATLMKASPILATKTNAQPVAVKSATLTKAKTHRNDRPHFPGGSDVHLIKMESQMETGESRLLGDPGLVLPSDGLPSDHENQIPPIDLHCGGNNDLGWCDLGPHYPNSEVSQIMEVCEELVSRMYVETPSEPEIMEDILSYSMSHNITDHFSRRWDSSSWKWDGKPVIPYQGTLCDVEKSYIRPSFAQDIRGKWHVIIQTDKFPQRVPLEVCRNPGGSCHEGDVCNHQSQCVQKYTYQHLISFDPESAESCPFIRLYKFPTSCVCRIPTSTGH